MFLEPGHQLNQVAGPGAVVELRAEDFLPTVAAGRGRARQREQIGAVGHAAGGAGLHGRGADLLKTPHAEQFSEAQNLFLIDRGEGLGRDVAAGEAGAAGGDDDFDLLIIDPLAELGFDLVLVVGDDGPRGEVMARLGDIVGQDVAGFVVGLGAGVGDRQHRDVDGDELAGVTGRHGPRRSDRRA